MTLPPAPANLPSLVAQTYDRAFASGDVIFTSSAAISEVKVGTLTYILRFCPSLAHKPKPPSSPLPSTKPNPFLPPSPALLIASNVLSTGNESYNLVLNKFPIIPHHFILSTALFAPQDAALTAADLAAVYAVLCAWQQDGTRLYAFFNCGEFSGASQAHRHVQFVTVDAERALPADLMPQGQEGVWRNPEVKGMGVFSVRLGERSDGKMDGTAEWMKVERLVEAYEALRKACGEGSYNMGMTKEWVVMAGRRSEGVRGVGVNGTVLAGEMMVKTEEEWDWLQKGGVEEVLGAIGVDEEEEVRARV